MISDDLAIQHLLLRLRPISRSLRAAVEKQAQTAARLTRADLVPLCVTDQHVSMLLEDIDRLADGPCDVSRVTGESLSDEEHRIEEQYRQQAAQTGTALPLDHLAEVACLSPFETDMLLLCAASELDRSYERIFAYILDDLNRRFPCIELLCIVGVTSMADRLARRQVLSRFGRLHRCGLIERFGEPTAEWRAELRLGPGVLEFLSGACRSAAGLWRDPDEIDTRSHLGGAIPHAVSTKLIERLGQALAERRIGLVGVWGKPNQGADDTAIHIARCAQLPLRRIALERLNEPARAEAEFRNDILAAAAVLGALLVPVDLMHDGSHRALSALLARLLATCEVPVLLVGSDPWRPTELLAARPYAEIELSALPHATRQALWKAALPQMDATRVADVAARFRMSSAEVDAATGMARQQAWLSSNGTPAQVENFLNASCAAVARKSGGRFATVVQPRRGPADLILPADLHRQIIEIADFTRALPRVMEEWGFDRLTAGGAGIKCLFTGEPGTGKTLAAEVVAQLLGVPMLKINIGETVSKWVGETEKNLDEAFRHAESSHALLFFDEADALFGKRGEVQRGVDRYANTEVSHLLQRLEAHDGLVILASNLKENLDPAFIRRFQVSIHFPRPSLADRRRLWQIAFPPQAPLDAYVDFDAISKLDMTGAGIVGAARTAAMLVADRGAPCITMAHVVHGIARQYRRESRVLAPSEFGAYESLLGQPP